MAVANCDPCNKIWKPTLFNIKKGWVSNLLCFLFFLKSLFADQQPVLFMARVPGALFLWVCRYNKPYVFDQSDRAYYLSYFIKGYQWTFTKLYIQFAQVLQQLLYPLHSCSNKLLLFPRSKKNSYGDRRFSITGPKLWNSIPPSLRNADPLNSFTKHLKTYSFRQAFS